MRSQSWCHEEAKGKPLPDRLRERCATFSPTGFSCDDTNLDKDDWCERCLAADKLETKKPRNLVTWEMPARDARDLLRWLRKNRPLGMPDGTFNGLVDAVLAVGSGDASCPLCLQPWCAATCGRGDGQ